MLVTESRFVGVVVRIPEFSVRIPLTVSLLPRIAPLALFNTKLLNVVAEVPPIVCDTDPLNVTVDVPAEKVPELVKFPAKFKFTGPDPVFNVKGFVPLFVKFLAIFSVAVPAPAYKFSPLPLALKVKLPAQVIVPPPEGNKVPAVVLPV